MKAISISLPDDLYDEAVGALCAAHDYQPALPNGELNPTPPEKFARNIVRSFILQAHGNHRIELAKQRAGEAEAAVLNARYRALDKDDEGDAARGED